MPVAFLTAEQCRRYGRFGGEPTSAQLDRYSGSRRSRRRRWPGLAVELDEAYPLPTRLRDLAVPLLAPAAGTDRDGAAVLLACSVGFDPTFVPMAAEFHAARTGAETGLLLVS